MYKPLTDQPVSRGRPAPLTQLVVGLLLFGISFGYVEAAVAIYLRELYEPMHQRVFPDRSPGDLFPLIPLDQLEVEEPRGMQWLATELLREGATLVMLAALALCVARSFQHGLAVFLIAFGLWDLFYYVFLKVLLDWPTSLLTWDLLFLLPVPWAGPVLAPVLVALGMIGTGGVILWRFATGRPLRVLWQHWIGLGAGGLMIMASFCWNYRLLLGGGYPDGFNWPCFVTGACVGFFAFVHAWWQDFPHSVQ